MSDICLLLFGLILCAVLISMLTLNYSALDLSGLVKKNKIPYIGGRDIRSNYNTLYLKKQQHRDEYITNTNNISIPNNVFPPPRTF